MFKQLFCWAKIHAVSALPTERLAKRAVHYTMKVMCGLGGRVANGHPLGPAVVRWVG